MNTYIKNILETKGWQDIEKMFNDKIKSCYSLELPKDASNETVAREARTKEDVASNLKELLKKIKLAGKEAEIKKPKKYI